MPTLSERLCAGLLAIHANPPRIIAAPATSTKASSTHLAASFGHTRPGLTAQALTSTKLPAGSVAIIVRIRPSDATDAPRWSAASLPRSGTPSQTSEAPSGPPDSPVSPGTSVTGQITSFFSQPWVRNGIPEVLFIKRAARPKDRWSSHIAFPGGRQDPEDEGPMFTALRECYEEVGIDLAERDYLPIGQLDDREITSSLGKSLLMVLSPFVYLHTGKETPIPELQASEVASAHWVPLSHRNQASIVSVVEMTMAAVQLPDVRWGDVPVDLGSRLAPRNVVLRNLLRLLVGQMHFRCILLPNDPIAVSDEALLKDPASLPELKLWGLTLGLCLDLIAHMSAGSTDPNAPVVHPSPATYPFLEAPPTSAGSTPWPSRPTTPSSTPGRIHSRHSTDSSLFGNERLPGAVLRAPALASVMPRFEGPDLNFLLWLFSWRYRRHLRKWDCAGVQDRRVNWAGMALSSFYSALRRALVVSIILRALVVAGGLTTAIAWMTRRYKQARLQRRIA